ncbi:hypothetical protein BaOVIS_021430 [Babesia ovis]|uniref:Uncharacterized protein n=1 Tax=Babesia ovis TaxID=5869 RepID=A0A9W5TAS2_BABOV|nr:hypothetical protein BaOVIS_021430 [Babesia ovis]
MDANRFEQIRSDAKCMSVLSKGVTSGSMAVLNYICKFIVDAESADIDEEVKVRVIHYMKEISTTLARTIDAKLSGYNTNVDVQQSNDVQKAKKLFYKAIIDTLREEVELRGLNTKDEEHETLRKIKLQLLSLDQEILKMKQQLNMYHLVRKRANENGTVSQNGNQEMVDFEKDIIQKNYAKMLIAIQAMIRQHNIATSRMIKKLDRKKHSLECAIENTRADIDKYADMLLKIVQKFPHHVDMVLPKQVESPHEDKLNVVPDEVKVTYVKVPEEVEQTTVDTTEVKEVTIVDMESVEVSGQKVQPEQLGADIRKEREEAAGEVTREVEAVDRKEVVDPQVKERPDIGVTKEVREVDGGDEEYTTGDAVEEMVVTVIDETVVMSEEGSDGLHLHVKQVSVIGAPEEMVYKETPVTPGMADEVSTDDESIVETDVESDMSEKHEVIGSLRNESGTCKTSDNTEVSEDRSPVKETVEGTVETDVSAEDVGTYIVETGIIGKSENVEIGEPESEVVQEQPMEVTSGDPRQIVVAKKMISLSTQPTVDSTSNTDGSYEHIVESEGRDNVHTDNIPQENVYEHIPINEEYNDNTEDETQIKNMIEMNIEEVRETTNVGIRKESDEDAVELKESMNHDVEEIPEAIEPTEVKLETLNPKEEGINEGDAMENVSTEIIQPQLEIDHAPEYVEEPIRSRTDMSTQIDITPNDGNSPGKNTNSHSRSERDIVHSGEGLTTEIQKQGPVKYKFNIEIETSTLWEDIVNMKNDIILLKKHNEYIERHLSSYTPFNQSTSIRAHDIIPKEIERRAELLEGQMKYTTEDVVSEVISTEIVNEDVMETMEFSHPIESLVEEVPRGEPEVMANTTTTTRKERLTPHEILSGDSEIQYVSENAEPEHPTAMPHNNITSEMLLKPESELLTVERDVLHGDYIEKTNAMHEPLYEANSAGKEEVASNNEDNAYESNCEEATCVSQDVLNEETDLIKEGQTEEVSELLLERCNEERVLRVASQAIEPSTEGVCPVTSIEEVRSTDSNNVITIPHENIQEIPYESNEEDIQERGLPNTVVTEESFERSVNLDAPLVEVSNNDEPVNEPNSEVPNNEDSSTQVRSNAVSGREVPNKEENSSEVSSTFSIEYLVREGLPQMNKSFDGQDVISEGPLIKEVRVTAIFENDDISTDQESQNDLWEGKYSEPYERSDVFPPERHISELGQKNTEQNSAEEAVDNSAISDNTGDPEESNPQNVQENSLEKDLSGDPSILQAYAALFDKSNIEDISFDDIMDDDTFLNELEELYVILNRESDRNLIDGSDIHRQSGEQPRDHKNDYDHDMFKKATNATDFKYSRNVMESQSQPATTMINTSTLSSSHSDTRGDVTVATKTQEFSRMGNGRFFLGMFVEPEANLGSRDYESIQKQFEAFKQFQTFMRLSTAGTHTEPREFTDTV